MINFIVCDDEPFFNSKISEVIAKVMMKNNLNYKTREFINYDSSFMSEVKKVSGKKVYILDIEVGNISGLDIARKIREKDWKSVIIIFSAHSNLSYQTFKKRLLILDFISKFDDYLKKIEDCINVSLEILGSNNSLSFVTGSVIYNIDYEDIIYIKNDKATKKVILKTYEDTIYLNMSLKEIEKKVSSIFVRTHRACIVNKKNIKSIDYKEKKIIFKDGSCSYLLSRNYKYGVKSFIS